MNRNKDEQIKHRKRLSSSLPVGRQNENLGAGQTWLDYEKQPEIVSLRLLRLESGKDLNTKFIENFPRFLTVIYTPWYDPRFRSYAISNSTELLEFLGWSDLSNPRILKFWVLSKYNLRKLAISNS
jgi:hypothetical protein